MTPDQEGRDAGDASAPRAQGAHGPAGRGEEQLLEKVSQRIARHLAPKSFCCAGGGWSREGISDAVSLILREEDVLGQTYTRRARARLLPELVEALREAWEHHVGDCIMNHRDGCPCLDCRIPVLLQRYEETRR